MQCLKHLQGHRRRVRGAQSRHSVREDAFLFVTERDHVRTVAPQSTCRGSFSFEILRLRASRSPQNDRKKRARVEKTGTPITRKDKRRGIDATALLHL